jgi:hypothetical protein
MNNPSHADEALLEAERAFAEGNYALVRERALPLVASEDAAARDRAQKLLAQISPAPIGKYLFLLAALLLLAVTYFAYAK